MPYKILLYMYAFVAARLGNVKFICIHFALCCHFFNGQRCEVNILQRSLLSFYPSHFCQRSKSKVAITTGMCEAYVAGPAKYKCIQRSIA